MRWEFKDLGESLGRWKEVLIFLRIFLILLVEVGYLCTILLND